MWVNQKFTNTSEITFKSNTAEYGPNIACFVSKITTNTTSKRRLKLGDGRSLSMNASSGSEWSMTMVLYDEYNQIVVTDNKTKAAINADGAGVTVTRGTASSIRGVLEFVNVTIA